MILAGVDEAGLGPPLGPLATARAVLEVADGADAATPWEALARTVARRAARGDKRLLVDDSKAAYAARGVPGLERTVLAFVLAAGGAAPPASWAEAEGTETEGSAAAPDVYPWHDGWLDPFPAFPESDADSDLRAAFFDDLRLAGVTVRHIAVRLAGPLALNRRFAAGENKNQALLRETGVHISAIAAEADGRPFLATVDKQGGRNSYLPFLAGLFPGQWIHTEAEGAAESRYRMTLCGGIARLAFVAKADALSFPTALASMAAKYARERAMAAFNRWFLERVPGIAPTAGYPLDAKRWLREAEGFFAESGIARELVARSR